MPHSSFGHDATAFRPELPTTTPWNIHACTSGFRGFAVSFGAWSLRLFGKYFSNRSGGSTTWSSMLIITMSSMFIGILSCGTELSRRHSLHVRILLSDLRIQISKYVDKAPTRRVVPLT